LPLATADGGVGFLTAGKTDDSAAFLTLGKTDNRAGCLTAGETPPNQNSDTTLEISDPVLSLKNFRIAVAPAAPAKRAEFAGGLAELVGAMANKLEKNQKISAGIAADDAIPTTSDISPAPVLPTDAPRQTAVPVAAATAAAAPAPAVASAVARCEKIVERIVASQPVAGQNEEVRIQIERAWLPGTEVKLTRAAGAELFVQFISTNPEAQRFLIDNLPGLRKRLNNRLDDEVEIRLSEAEIADGGRDFRALLYVDHGVRGRNAAEHSIYSEYRGGAF
jgi:hypothetical protein